MAVTLFVPNGRLMVENVAVPLLSAAVPRVVVVPPFVLLKETLPVAVDGVTVAVSITLAPCAACVDGGPRDVEDVDRVPAQAVARLFISIEPRPVTRL